MRLWLLILAAGLLTYLIRLSFILLLNRFYLPNWFRRSLRFVPVAVLSAILMPEVLTRNGALDISLLNPQLYAAAAAALVAWRTRNILLTILAGMSVLSILQALVEVL